MAGVTIREVAKEAGVSIATVSYVLNNSRRVGEENRRRVLDAAKRLDYRPNVTARNLQARETRLFGYCWTPAPFDQFNPILDSFLQAIGSAADRHGYRILTFPAQDLDHELAIYEEMILVGQVDGFVLSNTNRDDPRVQYLLEAGFPFVAFGRANEAWEFPWVDVDGQAGVQAATAHLIERGHRRIACLAWPGRSLTGQARLAGYRAAMAEGGLPVAEPWIARGENSHAEAYMLMSRLLALPADSRPSAVVAMSDMMALGAINALQDAGLVAGRDVAVAGFDDVPVAPFLRPPLTSVRQPIAEVGEQLVTMLVDVCRGRPIAEAHVLFCPQLIIRASSAAPYAGPADPRGPARAGAEG